MKKILFSFCFFSLMIVGAQAQKASCAKTCAKSAAASAACKEKAPSVATASTGDYSDAAAKLASLDASIETRTDATSGAVTYVRKETCSHSGKVSYVDLAYDAPSGTFVNASPSKMAEKASGCASKASNTSGKGCCASKAASAKTGEKVKS